MRNDAVTASEYSLISAAQPLVAALYLKEKEGYFAQFWALPNNLREFLLNYAARLDHAELVRFELYESEYGPGNLIVLAIHKGDEEDVRCLCRYQSKMIFEHTLALSEGLAQLIELKSKRRWTFGEMSAEDRSLAYIGWTLLAVATLGWLGLWFFGKVAVHDLMHSSEFGLLAFFWVLATVLGTVLGPTLGFGPLLTSRLKFSAKQRGLGQMVAQCQAQAA